jgi:hypothetical protein
MKLPARHEPTVKAKIEIEKAIAAAVGIHELTYAELMWILAQEMAGWTKWQIRDEREEVKP